MKKTVTKNIAKRFNWTPDQAESAISELKSTHTAMDVDKILTICDSSKVPDERIEQLVTYFFSIYKKDFVTGIGDLYNSDPCIQAIALFNFIDLKRELKKKGIEYVIVDLQPIVDQLMNENSEKHDIRLDKPNNFQTNVVLVGNPDNEFWKYVYAYDLSFYIIDRLITKRLSITDNKKNTLEKYVLLYLDEFELFSDLFVKYGPVVFRHTPFVDFVNVLSRTEKGKKLLSGILSSYSISCLTGPQATKRKYWRMYVLVSELLDRGYQPKEAYKLVKEHLGDGSDTIKRRYYQMREEAEKNKLTIKDIVRDNQLGGALEDFEKFYHDYQK